MHPPFSVERRRARLGRRHHLAAQGDDPVAVAGDLVGLHGTDPATVYLAAAARTEGVSAQDIEHALYERRALARVLGMRRTVFTLPLELLGVVYGACTDTIAARERRNIVKHLTLTGMTGDVDAWLAGVEAETLATLEARGEATGGELSDAVEGLRFEVFLNTGKPWDKPTRITTRVLSLLAAEGHIVRGRPTGGLTSSRYRWAPLRGWLPEGIARPKAAEARAELIRRWLATYGPGTLDDVQWWTGLTKTQVRAALQTLGAVEVELGGDTGWVLPDDLDEDDLTESWAALLPALDPTAMGWKERGWYLGPHEAPLFDRTGNIGPTVWWGGRIVGGWAQRDDGAVVVRLLEDVGAEAEARIEERRAALQGWLGDVRVTPRFRTPLERELVA
ncbi:MAG: AlkZ family DNA glycosylase [Alphaproteobacteria bacterium]|nr:AlkZ family DNA glycosylase [Alphaproteobacteria bacterium]